MSYLKKNIPSDRLIESKILKIRLRGFRVFSGGTYKKTFEKLDFNDLAKQFNDNIPLLRKRLKYSLS